MLPAYALCVHNNKQKKLLGETLIFIFLSSLFLSSFSSFLPHPACAPLEKNEGEMGEQSEWKFLTILSERPCAVNLSAGSTKCFFLVVSS